MPSPLTGRMEHLYSWRSIQRSIQQFLAISFSLGLSGLMDQSAWAIDRSTLILLTLPLEPTLFQANVPLAPEIVTPDRVSQTGLTPPSLWWAAQQFGNDLLSYWLAYPGSEENPRRVDLLVDSQQWNTTNYLRRYTFINQFGNAAKDFGYSTRVFNLQGELVGAYVCEPQEAHAAGSANSALTCSIFLNPYGRGALSGSTNPFGGAAPTGAEIEQYWQ